MPKLDSCIYFKAFGTSSDKTAHVRQLARMSQSCKISLASVYNVAKGYPVEFDKNKSLGPIQMYFFLLARDFRTHLSSMASLDSRPGLFPFADLFCRCLFCNCHFHLRCKFRLKFIFYFNFGCISMMVVTALCRGEIHFNMLFEFPLILIFSSTFGCASILVLS